MEIFLIKGVNAEKGVTRYIADKTRPHDNVFKTISEDALEQRFYEVVFFYSKSLAIELRDKIIKFQQENHPDSAAVIDVVRYRCSIEQMKTLRSKTYRYKYENGDDEDDD